MTQQQAKKLIKIGKYLLIAVFVIFFVIIVVQSININNLKATKSNLKTELNNKITLNESFNNQINNINKDFDKYSEEELRKDNYIKEDEILIG